MQQADPAKEVFAGTIAPFGLPVERMNRLHSEYSPHRLRSHLRRGGLVAYPTESVYGLGCLPQHPGALRRLVRLKKRPQHKGMIVIGEQTAQFGRLLQPLSAHDQGRLNAEWPAQKTFLLPARQNVLPLLRGKGRSTLAVRVPDHAPARRLCAVLRSALVSTSCNRSGGRPCTDEREVRRLFGRRVLLVGGRTGGAKQPSSITDWQSGRRIR